MNEAENDKPFSSPIAGDGLTDPSVDLSSTPASEREAQIVQQHGLSRQAARALIEQFGEDEDILEREARKAGAARRYP